MVQVDFAPEIQVFSMMLDLFHSCVKNWVVQLNFATEIWSLLYTVWSLQHISLSTMILYQHWIFQLRCEIQFCHVSIVDYRRLCRLALQFHCSNFWEWLILPQKFVAKIHRALFTFEQILHVRSPSPVCIRSCCRSFCSRVYTALQWLHGCKNKIMAILQPLWFTIETG